MQNGDGHLPQMLGEPIASLGRQQPIFSEANPTSLVLESIRCCVAGFVGLLVRARSALVFSMAGAATFLL